MTTRQRSRLTLKDKLSRLTFPQACRLLGPDGARLIGEGGRYDIDIDSQVSLTGRRFRLTLHAPTRSVVTIQLADDATQKLSWKCSSSKAACAEVGAALSLILEEKTSLGLAVEPEHTVQRHTLGERELEALEVTEREQRSKDERMRVVSSDPKTPWADYQVTNKASGKSYRVALRGLEPGQSYCSCPDYRKNTLGLCKHTLHVQRKVVKKFPVARLKRPFKLREIIVFVRYGKELHLELGLPDKLPADAERLVKRYRKSASVTDAPALVRTLRKLEAAGHSVTVYPDAEQYIQRRLWQTGIESLVAGIRKTPARHPLRTSLLKTELLPYQLDGIAFAVGAGRAVLADDMGLGKTIQGIGVAALLAREANISRVLVICPASLKSQWRAEIQRFSDYDCQLVVGPSGTRAGQYDNDCFFTVCNYEQVLRDIVVIEAVKWDLIILDEGQRIKNWEARTSRLVKSLKSPFALVLTGTPLENRIDELYSILEFIDDRRLGADFRFYHRHRVVDENGRVKGFRNLGQLRKDLQPVLLRRTRASVLDQLPPRTTEILRIPPTEEQLEVHAGHMRNISTITQKRVLSEMDLLRLQKALLMCRMSADSTALVDKQTPGYSSKLEALGELFDRVFSDPTAKVVLFSEWTGMLNLIEPLLKERSIGFARLDGSIAQQRRARLVKQFEQDEACRLFMMTNAGATGLNLQFANSLINIDLPWTPALLEQRIGRIHRMGQKQPVHVFVLVTEDTLEEGLLATLSAKHELALAVLDPDSKIDTVDMASGIEALKQRLEVLLGATPEPPTDESQRQQVATEAARIADRQRVEEAGGQLLGAAFNFLSQMLPAPKADATSAADAGGGADARAVENSVDVARAAELSAQIKQGFASCVETGADGTPRLTVALPDAAALDALADNLSRLLMSRS